MKVLIGIQARASSTRFPNKIFEKIGDKSVLQHVYETCSSVRIFTKALEIETAFVVPHDERAGDYCRANGFKVYEASGLIAEDDVVSRYDQAMQESGADFLIRITADCPLIDPIWIREAIKALMDYDYVSNVIRRAVPDGHDVQGINKDAWEAYQREAENREHVFIDIEQDYAFRNEFMQHFSVHALLPSDRVVLNPYHPENKISLDTPEDLERIRKVYEQLAKKS